MTPLYDPMVAKLIAWDVDRERATARMLRALGEYRIEPLTTLIPFHQAILATEQWAQGETCRDLTEDKKWLKESPRTPRREPAADRRPMDEPDEEIARAHLHGRGRRAAARGQGDRRAAPPAGAGAPAGRAPAAEARALRRWRRWRERAGAAVAASGHDPKVAVEKGAEVAEGALICVIEAMKMENEITAHIAGKVAELNVSEGAAINAGDQICKIE